MSLYEIKPYSYEQAKKLDVTIKPSHLANKKIDVIKDGKIIASIGAKGYKDFPTHLEEKGLKYANKRRKLYKIRHAKDLNNKNGNGYWSSAILW
jgi:hypothetical protein